MTLKMVGSKDSVNVGSGAPPPPLPPSVEEAYKKKCIELKRRMNEVEESNDEFRRRKVHVLRSIRKMRLERAMLLEILGKRMKKSGASYSGLPEPFDEESEGSSEGPPTPQEKPLRSKRGHRRPIPSPPSLPHQTPLSAGHQHPYNVYGTPIMPAGPSPAYQIHSNGGRAERLPQFHPHQQPMPIAYNDLPPTPIVPSTIPNLPSPPRPPITAEQYYHEEYKRREVSKRPDKFPPEDQLTDFLHKKWLEASDMEHQSWDQDYEERYQKYKEDMEKYQHIVRALGREVDLGGVYDEENGDEERDDDIQMEGDNDGVEEPRGGTGGFTAVNG